MIHAESILVALAAPLLVAHLLVRGDTRRFLGFFILGLVCCLLSAHINSFLALLARMDAREAAVKLTPVSEELMKALPVLFYLAVARPRRNALVSAALGVGLGFATFENVYFLVQINAPDLFLALIRGLSAGVMHAACAAQLGYGLVFLRARKHLLAPGAFGLLCAVSVFHGIYNLLVTAEGAWRAAGYVLPLLFAAALLAWVRRVRPRDA